MRRPRREDLERHQIPIAFSGLVAGILTGLGYPDLASLWEALVYPTLGLLLYATFLQIPFASLRRAFAD
ncbi:MAG: hypothetical protein NZL87_08615, partial [Thermomicrobium sp.]|nr:hypothetical protein [Thermomicrobium sp.]